MTFKEIFLHDEYDLRLPKVAQTVFDLGANVGYASIYFAVKYPDAKVYAYEPDPENFTLLKKNTTPFSNITIHRVAVAPVEGCVSFFSNTTHGTASSLIRRNKTDKEISVKAKPVAALMSELNIKKIDILKFDIEGYEEKVITDNLFPVGRIGYIVGEVHGDLMRMTIDEFCLHVSKYFFITKKRLSRNRILVSGENSNTSFSEI